MLLAIASIAETLQLEIKQGYNHDIFVYIQPSHVLSDHFIYQTTPIPLTMIMIRLQVAHSHQIVLEHQFTWLFFSGLFQLFTQPVRHRLGPELSAPSVPLSNYFSLEEIFDSYAKKGQKNPYFQPCLWNIVQCVHKYCTFPILTVCSMRPQTRLFGVTLLPSLR
jgi:hypothetical protein